jgi:ferredoxin
LQTPCTQDSHLTLFGDDRDRPHAAQDASACDSEVMGNLYHELDRAIAHCPTMRLKLVAVDKD